MFIIKEVIKETTVQNSRVFVFKSHKYDRYVKEVNYAGLPTDYTVDVEEALSMPTTSRYKNSPRYKALIKSDDIEAFIKEETTTYQTTLEQI